MSTTRLVKNVKSNWSVEYTPCCRDSREAAMNNGQLSMASPLPTVAQCNQADLSRCANTIGLQFAVVLSVCQYVPVSLSVSLCRVPTTLSLGFLRRAPHAVQMRSY